MRIRQGSTDITRQMINKGVQDIVARVAIICYKLYKNV